MITLDNPKDKIASFVKNGDGFQASDDLSAQQDFLESEIAVLSVVSQRIADRLGHEGSIKVLHRDNQSVFACSVAQDECRGTFLSRSETPDSEVLATL